MKRFFSNPVYPAIVVAVILLAATSAKVAADRHNSVGSFDVSSVLPPPITQPSAPTKEINKAELSKNDGKDGHRCYVAVSGVVYEIQEGKLWNNGKHDTSNGLAYCGADLTEAIKQSPHGTSKLQELPKIGVYKP